jgi:anti-sigma factor RsiW
MTCARRTELGVYLVGAIHPDERARMRAHLAECAECRCELDELAPVAGLLTAAMSWYVALN